MFSLVKPVLFALDPEKAHHLAMFAFSKLPFLYQATRAPGPGSTVFGLSFPNALGLAAGFDKNAEYLDCLGRLGFGFIEVGTVTPRPQQGRDKPRIFRIPERQALINRMGFPNVGLEKFLQNVARAKYQGILGINIGKNSDTPNEAAIADYQTCLRGVFDYSHYIAINVSSPNTENLRRLQERGALEELLSANVSLRNELERSRGRRVPLLVKVAPDLNDEQIEDICTAVRNAGVEGVIATNTTLDHSSVAGLPFADEMGGLSGEPLRAQSRKVLGALVAELGAAVPVVAVGGIFSAADARECFALGAKLIQIYTGFVYRGPGIVRELAQVGAEGK